MDSDSDWSDHVEQENGRRKEKGNQVHGSGHTEQLVPANGVADHNSENDLVGADGSGRNWKGILIAILVIAAVCGLIGIAIVLVTPENDDENNGLPFTFEDAFSSKYSPRSFDARWISDTNAFIWRSMEGDLKEYDADKNVKLTVMERSIYSSYDNDVYHVSPDRNYVLLASHLETIYRHSFLAKYIIYNRLLERFLPFPQSAHDEWKGSLLQYANWSPKDNRLTFVYKCNLYYQSDLMSTPIQLTFSGVTNLIYNGIPDWLYEEEILHTNYAHWWSPDGRMIAYIQFNDTLVPAFHFLVYGESNDLYGTVNELPYPKAGDTREHINPTAKLFLIDTMQVKNTHRMVPPPSELENRDHYITLVRWKDDGQLLVGWSNRAQNKTIMTLCQIPYDASIKCSSVLTEVPNEGKGWVQIEEIKFINNGRQFLTILAHNEGPTGYWKQIAMINADMESAGLERIFLTSGTSEVTEILAYDESTRYVYYISTNGDPRKRFLMRVKVVHSGSRTGRPECLTCKDADCQYVSAHFSSSAAFYIKDCLGPDVPTYALHRTTDHVEVEILEDNNDLRKNLATKAVPKKEYFQFPSKSGQTIHGQMYLPPSLKTDQTIEYPVLVHTYGGPGTQLVTDEFRIGWFTYLVSSENVIYVSIDGRGSGGQGDRFLHDPYLRLGTSEIEDQITGGRFLNRTYPFIDEKRFAIWGWSYGGFVVAHLLGDDVDSVYKCGIAVAPVTDWRYYDTTYTERYMGFPGINENFRGYDRANVSLKAKQFHGKEFLLVHGTADDNVHFQHSAQLIKALTEAEVTFRVQVYPDKNHGLTGERTSFHLYTTLTRFLQTDCWNGERRAITSLTHGANDDGDDVERQNKQI